jgi:hypothetical protein
MAVELAQPSFICFHLNDSIERLSLKAFIIVALFAAPDEVLVLARAWPAKVKKADPVVKFPVKREAGYRPQC